MKVADAEYIKSCYANDHGKHRQFDIMEANMLSGVFDHGVTPAERTNGVACFEMPDNPSGIKQFIFQAIQHEKLGEILVGTFSVNNPTPLRPYVTQMSSECLLVVGFDGLYGLYDVLNTVKRQLVHTIDHLYGSWPYTSDGCPPFKWTYKPDIDSWVKCYFEEQHTFWHSTFVGWAGAGIKTLYQSGADLVLQAMYDFYPQPDQTVVQWIEQFRGHCDEFGNGNPREYQPDDILIHQFTSGYCYFFACMLKEAFSRGTVCLCYPFGHFVWRDSNSVAYDINGVYTGEAEHLVPIKYMGDMLNDFLHRSDLVSPDTSDDRKQHMLDAFLNDQSKGTAYEVEE